jgi:hypothetical protein
MDMLILQLEGWDLVMQLLVKFYYMEVVEMFMMPIELVVVVVQLFLQEQILVVVVVMAVLVQQMVLLEL